MSQRPGEIRTEIAVRLPRPRTAAVLASREFVDLRRRGLELVRREARPGEVGADPAVTVETPARAAL
jgi:hypothetical protein